MHLSYFSSSDIINMDQRKRTAFINSLSGFKSASLIGTIDCFGNHNLAIFSSVVHIGSNPPLIGFISRPDTTSRHTLENILNTKCFTVNLAHTGIYKQAHQTAARYERNISEFEATGLTPEFSEKMIAPYVKESRIKYGMSFAEKHHLTINGTILVIGKLEEAFFPPHCLFQEGSIDIEKAETIAVSGLDSYHRTQRLSRLTYAKPYNSPEEIP